MNRIYLWVIALKDFAEKMLGVRNVNALILLKKVQV